MVIDRHFKVKPVPFVRDGKDFTENASLMELSILGVSFYQITREKLIAVCSDQYARKDASPG